MVAFIHSKFYVAYHSGYTNIILLINFCGKITFHGKSTNVFVLAM